VAASGVNVIVGGGLAGATAARSMRAAGFDGDIVLIGGEPHLPYDRPPLSKQVLLDAPRLPSLFDEQFYRANGITLRLGVAVTEVDRQRQRLFLQDGSCLPYDKLLLATGGRARRLEIDRAAHADILYLRDFEDSLALRRRLREVSSLLVVGGGFIGLEVAAAAAKLGCRVVVVEAAATILGRMGYPIVSDFTAAYHHARNIDVRVGIRPVAIARHDGAIKVVLSTAEHLSVDLVLAGLGIVPDTRLAEAAGLRVDNGILVDARGRTSDPHIFAAGDVASRLDPLLGRSSRLESWHNAYTQGAAVGRAMAGEPIRSAEVPWVWSDQGDLNLQFAGTTSAEASLVVRGAPGNGAFTAFLAVGSRLIGAATVNQGHEMVLIRRMLASERSFDPGELADPKRRLRQLVA
jgi:NADPH-dependent 2,4-dienoyl-CoA reductase/sulfur reductase-like enzyme